MQWNPKGDLARVRKVYETGSQKPERIAKRLKLPVSVVRRMVVMCKVMCEK